VKQLFETVANTRVEVETVETVATGSENCCFRITVLGESQPSEAPSA
jgi:predicted hydrocarbon binding protein